MDMFTKSLALELGPHKVSNNVSQRYQQATLDDIFLKVTTFY